MLVGEPIGPPRPRRRTVTGHGDRSDELLVILSPRSGVTSCWVDRPTAEPFLAMIRQTRQPTPIASPLCPASKSPTTELDSRVKNQQDPGPAAPRTCGGRPCAVVPTWPVANWPEWPYGYWGSS